MQFYPVDAPVPERLRTDVFLLRPLCAVDNPLDYEAVMATQESLRQSGTGGWPRPDFTPEENLVDLQGHEDDFHARRGFTYTILDPSETRCLGCFYIYPLDEVLRRVGADDETVARVEDFQAVGWFWLRPDAVAEDLDRTLLTVLIPWLHNDFPFDQLVIATWAVDERQVTLLSKAGLRVVWSHQVGDKEVLHFA
jgi:hypothetical protein